MTGACERNIKIVESIMIGVCERNITIVETIMTGTCGRNIKLRQKFTAEKFNFHEY